MMARIEIMTEKIYQLASVNILWILFSVLGLIIFGIGPATTAALSVIRGWIKQEEREGNMFQIFWRVYKESFVQANILWFILLLIGFVLYVDLYFIFRLDHFTAPLLLGIGVFMVILYVVVIIFSFPLLISLEINALKSIKYALIYGLTSPILTLTLSISLMMVQYISYHIPVAYLFFTVSVTSYLILVVIQRNSYKLNIEEM